MSEEYIMRLISIILVSIMLASTVHAKVIKCRLSDSSNHPVSDAQIYADCRDNYFFTDQDGVALIYVEPDYIDCILEVTHADFLSRKRLLSLGNDSDTTDFEITLTRPGEIEHIIPNDRTSRFIRVQPCGSISEFKCVDSIDSDGNKFTVSFTPDGNTGSFGFMLTLDAGEIEMLGSENGYDLNSAEKLVFSAKSVSGEHDVIFMSLLSDCDENGRSCPTLRTKLTNEFARYEINLSRWNRDNVKSILGCMVEADSGNSPIEIEISNLGILHSSTQSVSDAGVSAH